MFGYAWMALPLKDKRNRSTANRKLAPYPVPLTFNLEEDGRVGYPRKLRLSFKLT